MGAAATDMQRYKLLQQRVRRDNVLNIQAIGEHVHEAADDGRRKAAAVTMGGGGR